MPVNAMLAWADLTRTVGEMWVASAQVIAYRTMRMTIAGPAPNARDRAEFTRMSQEKYEAAAEAARNVLTHMTNASVATGARAFRHFVTGNAALYALMTSRNASQSVTNHAALVRSLSRSAQSAFDLAHSPATLARHGIKPIHARATANAKRLRGR